MSGSGIGPGPSAGSRAARFGRDAALLLAITFLLCEASLRVFNPIYVPLRADGIQLPVNRVFEQRITNNSKVDEHLVVRYNGIGLRGPEFPQDPQRHVKIFTVGGSTTACVTLTDGRTWPDLLRSKLDAPLGDVWLNNAGMDGHSTYGHLVLLDAHLARFAPDYILYLVGLNDVARDDISDYDAAMIGRSRPLKERIIAASELLSMAQVIRRSLRAYDMGLNHSRPLDLREISRVNEAPGEAERELARHEQHYLPAFRARIRELVARTRAVGATPVLITQPALYGSGVDPATGVEIGALETPRQGLPAALEWRVLELYNEALRTISSEDAVMLIDLAAHLPKSSAYYFDWVHFSNEGAAAVAELVAQELLPVIGQERRKAIP